MKIFIAGATGVLGRATVPRLVAAGHEVHGVARSPEKAAQLRAQGAEPLQGVDLFDPASVRTAVDGADAVVHMATSIPPVRKGWRTKAWAMNDRLRREGTPILGTAAREAGVRRFVKESVCFFYVPQGDSWIDEDSPIDRNNFAAASLAAEDAAVAFGADDAGDAEGRVGVALRFGLFYSHDARALEEGLAAAKLGVGPMLGAPDAYQPSIHVDDAATAIVAALGAPGGYYNVADEPITKAEWNAAFFEAFGIDRKHRSVPKLALKAGGQKVDVLAASRRISSQRFRTATGWAPNYPDAAVGLKAVSAAHRERQS
ncbi:MAG: NAD-dependent epimerase/dehydratase family protein [Actinomycetota bacterium]|nr:NAD-dependent epimerase/dehydratase family protein [Acidimicrobiia bacterium]MDQ3293381.1 NAD-dependent epimerase/dehydratase family protein [Actinomycetota bacterium]